MVTVRVVKPFIRRGEVIPTGTILTVPDEVVAKLEGYAEVVCEVWLAGDELRSLGVVPDLAAAIVELTPDNLDLQRQLLTEHCQAFDDNHLHFLIEAWQERSAIQEHDGGMTRQEAEQQAAKHYNLLGWLDHLRTIH